MNERPTRQQRREAARQAVAEMGQFQKFVGRQLADVCYVLEVQGEVLKTLGATPEQFAEAEEVVKRRRLGIPKETAQENS